jgi:hypothetical protein
MDSVCWEIRRRWNRAHRRGSALWTFFVYSLYQELQCTCLWKHVLGYNCDLCETLRYYETRDGRGLLASTIDRGLAQICSSEVETLVWEMHRHQSSQQATRAVEVWRLIIE